MKTAYWDSNFRWDDPNLRWGNPSYLLEPGDPGYVADPTSASFPATKPRKKKAMPKSDYIKRRDQEFAAQLLRFKTNIPAHATAFGLSAGQVTAQAADCDYFAYCLTCQDICNQCSEQWTAWKDIIRAGGDAGTPPEEDIFPTSVTPVAPGLERRFRDLVKIIKSHPAYNVAIGEALGIEGPQQTGPDLATIKPVLTLKLVGGQVMVGWGWDGNGAFLDMIEIHVNRSSGYTLLAYDTTPDYLDTTPAPNPAQKWTYKAIYRVGDQRVGQWSDEASITVSA